MVKLRATQKVLRRLPGVADPAAPSDTALGDWFVNRVVADRQPLLLLVSALSLLPVVIRAKSVATLPDRLPALVGERLLNLGIPGRLIQAEVGAMSPVIVTRTVDRSVLGIMVDFAKALPYYPSLVEEAALWKIEALLEETPCFAGKKDEDVVFPIRKTHELLQRRWG